MTPIDTLQFSANELIRDYPPQWTFSKKKIVYNICCLTNDPFEGLITYSRWPTQDIPKAVLYNSRFSVLEGVYTYEGNSSSDEILWHVSFADSDLFVAYGTALLAQDELQVAEHPILGSVREAVQSNALPAQTESVNGDPTPVTITGVQRRCAINTMPNPELGLDKGLYGNLFFWASSNQITKSVSLISPPSISNILAMAAPDGGEGEYRYDEITKILTIAYTGFLAARIDTCRLLSANAKTIINTGFWGCGAFGGNRSLMTILQCLAADLAGVEIRFWAFDQAGGGGTCQECSRVVLSTAREYKQCFRYN